MGKCEGVRKKKKKRWELDWFQGGRTNKEQKKKAIQAQFKSF